MYTIEIPFDDRYNLEQLSCYCEYYSCLIKKAKGNYYKITSEDPANFFWLGINLTNEALFERIVRDTIIEIPHYSQAIGLCEFLKQYDVQIHFNERSVELVKYYTGFEGKFGTCNILLQHDMGYRHVYSNGNSHKECINNLVQQLSGKTISIIKKELTRTIKGECPEFTNDFKF